MRRSSSLGRPPNSARLENVISSITLLCLDSQNLPHHRDRLPFCDQRDFAPPSRHNRPPSNRHHLSHQQLHPPHPSHRARLISPHTSHACPPGSRRPSVSEHSGLRFHGFPPRFRSENLHLPKLRRARVLAPQHFLRRLNHLPPLRAEVPCLTTIHR